eukprot:CAMPEP_0185774918 /NCGR_PEP_ID=MMETSP1174-20130828/80430_1 /TAXON_ID=35687 /ORGANISM="Dictyocha speculum, Strain CCMP1381" /LENGTH=131 /DNA_ID=CAMNT_0028462321 /DNA_START=168 /DNA_END=560 /DNA_ORIENTATION=+
MVLPSVLSRPNCLTASATTSAMVGSFFEGITSTLISSTSCTIVFSISPSLSIVTTSWSSPLPPLTFASAAKKPLYASSPSDPRGFRAGGEGSGKGSEAGSKDAAGEGSDKAPEPGSKDTVRPSPQRRISFS